VIEPLHTEIAVKKVNRREFVTAAAMAGAGAVLPAPPGSASKKHGVWASSSSAPALAGREVVALQSRLFPVQNVRLQEGPLRAAAEANRKYLKTLAPDRLLHTFRLTAGFPSSAEPLGEWEKPDCELRGHFAGGHYLSACALASSGDEELKRNGDLMVSDRRRDTWTTTNAFCSITAWEPSTRKLEQRFIFCRLAGATPKSLPSRSIRSGVAAALEQKSLPS
jgi:hypothetical protein